MIIMLLIQKHVILENIFSKTDERNKVNVYPEVNNREEVVQLRLCPAVQAEDRGEVETCIRGSTMSNYSLDLAPEVKFQEFKPRR